MKHYMKLKPEPFELIDKGIKIYELRLFDEKRKLLKVGDLIEFSNLECPNEIIEVKVEDLLFYPSFIDLYSDLPMTMIGYTEENKLIANYTDMEKYYSIDEQSKFGVVAIKIRKI